jgi:hypothetical protein
MGKVIFLVFPSSVVSAWFILSCDTPDLGGEAAGFFAGFLAVAGRDDLLPFFIILT